MRKTISSLAHPFWARLLFAALLVLAATFVQAQGLPGNSNYPQTGSGLPAGCVGTANTVTCPIIATSGLNGGFSGVEGTGASLSAGVGTDLFYPDSTLHDYHGNLNNVDVGGAAFASNTLSLSSKTLVNPRVLGPRRWTYSIASGNTTATLNAGANPEVATQAGTASAIAATTSEEAFIQWASGAVSGNQAGWSYNSLNDWFTGRNVYWGAYLKDANADLTNQRLWMGLTAVTDGNNTTTYNGDTPGVTNRLAMFRFSSVVPDTNWQCVTGNASAQTTTNSNIAADVNSHVFEIQYNDSTPSVLFYIDGVLVCTNTTNLPGNNQRMGALGVLTTQTTAAKNIQLAWQMITSDK